jgi:hypothetical protein
VFTRADLRRNNDSGSWYKNGQTFQIQVFVIPLTANEHSPGNVMTTNSDAIRTINHQTNLNGVPSAARSSVIDFVEARDRLSAEFLETAERCAAARKISDGAARRRRSIELTNRVEQSLYWLLSAAVLAYLALKIAGL